MQFAVNDAETLEFIKFGLVVDVDSEGNRWIYHSSFIVPKDSEMATEKDSGTILWRKFFPSLMLLCSIILFFFHISILQIDGWRLIFLEKILILKGYFFFFN